VVVITSTGGVSKKVFTFDRPLDSGLTDWAAAYLNERLVGMGLGARMLHSKLADPSLTKLFHFGRFDIGVLAKTFGVMAQPVYCTKIASRLARTYTDRHGLKDLTRELLGVDLSKQQQSSDWGAEALSDPQVAYAATDVLHLHALRERLDAMLAREGRLGLAQACFDFLPTRALLDLAGWPDQDIFAHDG